MPGNQAPLLPLTGSTRRIQLERSKDIESKQFN